MADRDQSGVLFRNTEKQAGDRRPDYTGHGVVWGKPVRIAAWLKQGRQGGTFLSLAFSEPRARETSNDDIPF